MNIKLLINSAINYETSLQCLLSSIQKCDNRFKNEDIIITKAGGSEYSIEIKDEITIITTDNNSFDFTALIAVNDLDIQATGFLYIHDTCILGSEFFNKANDVGYNHEAIKLAAVASMNIGYYSKKCLTTHKELLSKYKNQDYTQKGLNHIKNIAVRSEDIIFRKYANLITYQTHEPHTEGPINYYNTGTPRIKEHYSGLDLYKMKANYSGPSLSAYSEDNPLNWILNL